MPLHNHTTTTSNNDNNINNHPPTHCIRLVPHLDVRRILHFEPISRNLRDGDTPLRIGRCTDRSSISLTPLNTLNTNKLVFRSRVVSRYHAEIWSNNDKFYIKDTKSSTGTFLNNLRLSPADSESKPHQLKHGDIVQLGVDYRGGVEDIHKSINIRIELERALSNGELTGRPWTHHITTEATCVENFPDREPVSGNHVGIGLWSMKDILEQYTTEETTKDNEKAQRQHHLALSDTQLPYHDSRSNHPSESDEALVTCPGCTHCGRCAFR
ncbi:SMAD/FHA domain-containing protein [Suillus subalutaceus]|uniref:SMAD/FHA domain-containing protein n=1 Tax=Suillus subalutaceus TaxID=48586 RepID=UPI001B85D50B|nr:SMAD/FHA domain-containing protein [Suillus subalutaceus]KAG1870674.1 SMAD/FHA domain-containing protein [Suillus subalutaceus]